MEKREKARIGAYAAILTHECIEIVENFSDTVDLAKWAGTDPVKISRLILATVGTGAYMVAEMGEIETAREMIEQHGDMYDDCKDKINPGKLTSGEAKKIINGYYQNARDVHEKLVTNGDASMDAIIEEQARAIFDDAFLCPDDADMKILKYFLTGFYTKIYANYCGET